MDESIIPPKPGICVELCMAEKEAGECGQAVRGLVRGLGMAEWKR